MYNILYSDFIIIILLTQIKCHDCFFVLGPETLSRPSEDTALNGRDERGHAML